MHKCIELDGRKLSREYTVTSRGYTVPDAQNATSLCDTSLHRNEIMKQRLIPSSTGINSRSLMRFVDLSHRAMHDRGLYGRPRENIVLQNGLRI